MGTDDGRPDGTSLGCEVGTVDGNGHGGVDGMGVGCKVGDTEGTRVGFKEGAAVGRVVDTTVGRGVGARTGTFEGSGIGIADGRRLGRIVGTIESTPDGIIVGAGDGNSSSAQHRAWFDSDPAAHTVPEPAKLAPYESAKPPLQESRDHKSNLSRPHPVLRASSA